MLITFAKNQSVVAIGGTPVVFYSDLVSLGENDRLSCICTVHNIETNSILGAPQLDFTAQLSNDGGQTYVNSAVVTDTTLAVGTRQKVGVVNAALVRFQFVLSNGSAGGTDISTALFDLHVEIDHA